MEPSFAASLYGARSTSSRVSGWGLSPVLRPPLCGAGCRAVRRAVSGADLHAGSGRVQRVLASCSAALRTRRLQRPVPRAAISFNASCVRGEHGSRRSTFRGLEFGPCGRPVCQIVRPARQIVRQLALQDSLLVRQFSRQPGPRFRPRSARIGVGNPPWRPVP